MPAPELVVGDSQPQVLELGDDLPTGSVDRERPVLYAVGDEDLGGAMGMIEIREAGREGDHVAKQIAVRHAERQRVGGAVGEPRDPHARWVDAVATEDALEEALDERDVRPIPAEDVVPGWAERLHTEQDGAASLGDGNEPLDRVHAVASGTVEDEHERGQPRRTVR